MGYLLPVAPCFWSVPRCRDRVALTFDDGPTNLTATVLDILKAEDVKATFFVLGRRVVKYPELVTRMRDEGHEVGIHGYDHTIKQFAGQVARCYAELAKLGVRPICIRPPWGKVELIPLLRHWVRGYRTVLFNFDTHDSMRYEGKWPDVTPDFSAIRGGDIVLMHDDNPICIGELSNLLQKLREMSMQTVTVSELTQYRRRTEPYEVSHNN